MKRSLFSLIGIVSALGTSAYAETKATPAAARLQLVTMAETGSTAVNVDDVRKLVESYRIDPTSGFMPLKLAPYPRFLINAQMSEIYPALYKSEFNSFINNIPLELLFDGILDMVAKNTVPASLKKDLSGLDRRMAARAILGKAEACRLDGSEKLETVKKISLIMLKIDIVNSYSPCMYRHLLFNAAKPALMAARKLPETKKTVAAAAKDKFPVEFRKGFLTKINDVIDGFPKLVGQKFGAGETVHPIWSDLGSVVEADSDAPVRGGHRTIALKSFAQGLLADLFAANVLMKSTNPRDRSLAAGLFYAVVNRWLLLTGGIEADWDVQKHEMPVAVMGKGLTPPKFREVRFGGWGAETEGFGVSMSPWDWGKYAPSAAENPSALRIFPTRFTIDSAGVASAPDPSDAYQTNDDLAYMLLAVSEFLKATQPGMPLAQFFGGKDQIADLLDPAKPMLFPMEGRMIAVGVLSAIAQNLLHPAIGHVASKRDGIPIYFRDHGSFDSLQETDLDTRGVCSLLVAASKLTQTLKADPLLATNPELKPVLPQISQLVQISALVVGREQGFDGSIPAKMVSNDKTSNLGAQIAAVRVFLAAFNNSADPANATFVMARLVPAITYLFNNQIADSAGFNLESRLNLLAVWNLSQASLRPVRPDLPWDAWEVEMRKISVSDE